MKALTADYYICGGSFDSAVESASITMTGGNVLTVFGGGVCAGATVEGDVTISLAGGDLDKFVGGGICGAVKGDINITMAEDTEIRENFIGGGFMEGADVANVNIEINGGSIDNGSNYAIMTGGGVSSDVKGKVSITIDGGDINAVVAAGSMLTGSVAETEIEVNGGKVLSLAGGNCDYYGYGEQDGSVGNVAITVTGGTICDAIQGGSVYNAPVTGNVTIDVLGGTIGTMGADNVIIAEYIGGTATVNISSEAVINGGIKGADVFTVDKEAADFSTIFVDPNYHNCDFETGKIAGINVFAKFTDALQLAAKDSSVSTVKIESSIAEEIMPTDVELLVNNDLIITADSAVTVNLKNNGTSYDLVLGANTKGKTITFGKNVTLTLNDRIIWAGYYGNNVDVVIEGTVSASQWWNGADTTIKAGGKLISSGEAMVFRRGATVTIIGDAAQGAAEADRQVQLDANYFSILSGNLIASDTLIKSGPVWVSNTGSYCNESTAWISLDNTILNSTGNLKLISDQTALMEVENGSVLNITNHDGYAASEIGTNGFLWIYDSTASFADLNNAGDIDLYNSTFTVNGTLTNNGVISVSGISTLNIATLTGEDINFLDGAIIKDSTVGGNVFVAGNVTFRGDNTFGMLYDFGTLTENYETTAPMAWTVEAGSSLTLTNTGRYGLGYGDKVVINGNIAEGGAAAARATLTDDDAANDVKQSLFMHGLVAQESKGWNCDSSFTVNNAFVTIGSNNSFGNKPGNYGGTYTFSFNNAVVNASRITFYEALSTTKFTFKDSDVNIGQFMTRDTDSEFTLDNTNLLSTATTNGTDEGNYNAGTLNITNGSNLTYSFKMFNEGTGIINVNNATFIAPEIVNSNIINISGESAIDSKVTGDGWINMDTVILDKDTNIQGGKVRFTNGESTLDGAIIKGNAFQVGLGGYMLKDERENAADVVVNVNNNSYINAADVDFYGWIGSGFFDTDAQKAEAMTAARYILNVNNSIAHYGYLHISNDGILNVTGNAAEKESYAGVSYSFWGGRFIVNGVATFDNVDVAAQFTNISCDNKTDEGGKLIIKNGATYVSWRDGNTADTSFQINNKGSVEVDGATLDLRHGTLIEENATLTVTNKGIFKGNAITNAGTISLDATVSFSANTLTGTGTITIDAADFVGTKKIIDLSGTESLEGKVTVENLAEGTNVFFYEDGDVVLSSAAIDKLFVNAAYAGNTGDSTEDGKFIGVNAFADITSAIKAAEAQGGATIDMTDVKYSGKQQGETAKNGLFQTNGTYTFTNGDYADFVYVDSPRPTEENAGLVDVNIVFDNAKMVANKFRLDNGASLTIKDSHIDCNDVTSRGWTTYYGDSTIDITNSVVGWDIYDQGNSEDIKAGDKETLYAASNAQAGAMTWQGSGVMTVKNSTIFAFTDEGAYAASYAVYDRGLISFKDSAVYGKTIKVGLDYPDKTAGRDGEIATMVFDNSVLRDLNGDGATQIVVGDGSDTAGKLIVTNSVIDYAGATMTINTNGIAEFSSSKITVNSVSNKGELVFNFANINTIDADGLLLIDAAKASNYGTVTLNGLDAKYEAVTIGEDLYAFDMSTLYVDSTYGTYTAGERIAEGIFMGINAFASFKDLNDSIYSAGVRTVKYVAEKSGSLTLTVDCKTYCAYTINGGSAIRMTGSKDSVLAVEAGDVVTLDFTQANGDFEISRLIAEKNKPIDSEFVDGSFADEGMVSTGTGEQVYNITVETGTIGNYEFSLSNLTGAVKYELVDVATGEILKTYTASGATSGSIELGPGSYQMIVYPVSKDKNITFDFDSNITLSGAGNVDLLSNLDDTFDGAIDWGTCCDAEGVFNNWIGTGDTVDWIKLPTGLAAGRHTFSYATDGDMVTFEVYQRAEGSSADPQYSTYFYTTSSGSKSIKLSAGVEYFIKATTKKTDAAYSITIA